MFDDVLYCEKGPAFIKRLILGWPYWILLKGLTHDFGSKLSFVFLINGMNMNHKEQWNVTRNKFLWDFSIQSDIEIQSRRSDNNNVSKCKKVGWFPYWIFLWDLKHFFNTGIFLSLIAS